MSARAGRIRRPEQALSELKREAWRNAVRLYGDACVVFCGGSHATAFALAVLSFEEIGKVMRIDRACDGLCMNPDSREFWLDLIARDGFLTVHRTKQVSAYYDTVADIGRLRENPKFMSIFGGGLDLAKQQALYVELEDWRVATPAR